MDYYGNGDLHEAIYSRAFTVHDTAKMLSEIACGLSMIHAAEIVHRDLKPPNILIDHGMRCAISDFGIAIRSDCVQPGMIEGTEGYLAPEMVAGLPYGTPLDIWCFSRILEAVASGEAVDPPRLSNNTNPVWMLDLHDHSNAREPYRRKSAAWLTNRLDHILDAVRSEAEAGESGASPVAAEAPAFVGVAAIRRGEGEDVVQDGRKAEKMMRKKARAAGNVVDPEVKRQANQWRKLRRKAAPKAAAES